MVGIYCQCVCKWIGGGIDVDVDDGHTMINNQNNAIFSHIHSESLSAREIRFAGK